MTVYGSRPTSRRRTKAEIEAIKKQIEIALATDHPMTVRQLFYRLVTRGVISKSEAEYKGTVIRLTGEMRLAGRTPFDFIADNTRWMRKPTTHSGLERALMRTAQAYRRSIWDDQDVYVEIWLEKDALAGVLYEVTHKWDVPLMVAKGFASLSFLHSAADAIRAIGKPTFLYYFGDHDPSGLVIPRSIEARLRQFVPDAEIHFERVAVTSEQIEAMGLPTRPTKKTDSRSKNFEGGSVEVDAIEPAVLRQMAEECITKHIDQRTLEATTEIEKAERQTLKDMAFRYIFTKQFDLHPSTLDCDTLGDDSDSDEPEGD